MQPSSDGRIIGQKITYWRCGIRHTLYGITAYKHAYKYSHNHQIDIDAHISPGQTDDLNRGRTNCRLREVEH